MSGPSFAHVFLAAAFTRWTPGCDKKLHRLVSYIDTTAAAMQIGWVGDDLSTLQPCLYAERLRVQ